MLIIICIDDDLGMAFNHRRQSQDGILRKRILEITSASKLWMSNYSGKQFAEEDQTNIIFDDDYLQKAAAGEFCFVELDDIAQYGASIEKLIIYRWNRHYPSDLKFTLDISDRELESSFEFEGSSHEKITEDILIR